MTPDRTHVRLWYAACAMIAAPWWLILPFKFYIAGWFAALGGAVLLTPKVTPAIRALGLLVAVGLTVLIWYAIIYYVSSTYGDAAGGL